MNHILKKRLFTKKLLKDQCFGQLYLKVQNYSNTMGQKSSKFKIFGNYQNYIWILVKGVLHNFCDEIIEYTFIDR